MKRLNTLWRSVADAVRLQLALAVATAFDLFTGPRFDVGPDGRLTPRR